MESVQGVEIGAGGDEDELTDYSAFKNHLICSVGQREFSPPYLLKYKAICTFNTFSTQLNLIYVAMFCVNHKSAWFFCPQLLATGSILITTF